MNKKDGIEEQEERKEKSTEHNSLNNFSCWFGCYYRVKYYENISVHVKIMRFWVENIISHVIYGV